MSTKQIRHIYFAAECFVFWRYSVFIFASRTPAIFWMRQSPDLHGYKYLHIICTYICKTPTYLITSYKHTSREAMFFIQIWILYMTSRYAKRVVRTFCISKPVGTSHKRVWRKNKGIFFWWYINSTIYFEHEHVVKHISFDPFTSINCISPIKLFFLNFDKPSFWKTYEAVERSF